VLVLLAALLFIGGVSKSDGYHPSAAVARPSVYWGAYVAGGQYGRTDAPWDLTALSQFEANTGKRVSLLEWGQAWYECSTTCGLRPFRDDLLERARRHGAIPVLSWDSKHGGSGPSDPEFSLNAIIAGRYDSFIRDWAQGAKRWGHPFFLRFDWEMNTNGVPYSEHSNGNRPGEFVRMWRHVHDIFRRARARNVTWVWCPNVEYDGSVKPLRSLYPGARYVDWTCLDGYNWGTNPADPQGWRSFDKAFGPTYGLVTRKIAPSKPLMVGETGSSEFGGSKPGWITDMLTRQLPRKKYRRVKALVWFNKIWDGMDWIIESSPATRAAFARGIGLSHYASNRFRRLKRSVIRPLP
jgi:Glycosyl hydrolase family 26